MVRLSRVQAMEHAQHRIEAVIEEHGRGAVFTYRDLEGLLTNNKEGWLLPKVTTTKDFIRFLTEKGILSSLEVTFPYRTTQRYVCGTTSSLRIALSLRTGSYLSHYTAVYVHGLTENIPKSIYTNQEQSKKPQAGGTLTQESIDQAFARAMRKTNQIARFDGHRVYLLNGKHVNRIGVREDVPLEGDTVCVTNRERTLIDCTVRPGYAGGVQEVLTAYRRARGDVSVNRLLAQLKTMDFTYPYHQAIGFYLERAGYPASVLKLVEAMGGDYDFYLTYAMEQPAYSPRWRLYYPERLG